MSDIYERIETWRTAQRRKERVFWGVVAAAMVLDAALAALIVLRVVCHG